jgi:hypothetical protein
MESTIKPSKGFHSEAFFCLSVSQFVVSYNALYSCTPALYFSISLMRLMECVTLALVQLCRTGQLSDVIQSESLAIPDIVRILAVFSEVAFTLGAERTTSASTPTTISSMIQVKSPLMLYGDLPNCEALNLPINTRQLNRNVLLTLSNHEQNRQHVCSKASQQLLLRNSRRHQFLCIPPPGHFLGSNLGSGSPPSILVQFGD